MAAPRQGTRRGGRRGAQADSAVWEVEAPVVLAKVRLALAVGSLAPTDAWLVIPHRAHRRVERIARERMAVLQRARHARARSGRGKSRARGPRAAAGAHRVLPRIHILEACAVSEAVPFTRDAAYLARRQLLTIRRAALARVG